MQEVKDKVHAMQSLPHQRVCGLQRKCSTNKRRDNCGVSADHVERADSQNFVAVPKEGYILEKQQLLAIEKP